MTKTIDNRQDIIDSRDVIARIEELEDERNDLEEAMQEEREDGEAALAALEDWDDDYGDELKSLKSLADEAEGYAPDWKDGATLIRESYFVEAMQELVQDIGDLPRDIPGYLVIDWEATADNLRADYTEVDFDGVAYLVR